MSPYVNMIYISNSKHIILITYKDLITIELIEEARKVVTKTCEYNMFLLSRELGDLIKQPAESANFHNHSFRNVAIWFGSVQSSK